ncbi:pilin [Glycomyces sp. MUSA5-2]|uniref:pilin n=1 Tax=Glycomyces sp. MUSA5-2 TaxID=2053002 RepID=UPI003008B04B
MEAERTEEAPGVRPHRARLVLRGLVVLALAVTAVVVSAGVGWAAGVDLPGVASVETILNRIKTWIQAIALTFAVVMACIAGIRYLVSSDTTGTEKAKNGLRSAAIGLAIVLLAELLVGIAAYFIQGSE